MPMKFAMRWHGAAVQKLAEMAADRTARKAANYMLRQAKFHCPVRTGNLSSTIEIMTGYREGSWRVVATAPYAVFVEFGHMTQNGDWVPAQPFLRLALHDTLAEFPQLMREGWLEAVRDGHTVTVGAADMEHGGHFSGMAVGPSLGANG